MPLGKRNRSRSNRAPKRRMTSKFMQNYARKSRAKRSFQSRVKKTVLKMSETKYKGMDVTSNTNTFDGNGSYQTAQKRLFNNTGHRWRLWDNTTNSANGVWPSQGDTDANREGDRIMATGIKIRGKLEFNAQHSRQVVKAYYVPYNDLQGDPRETDEFFHNLTGFPVGLWPLSPMQTKRWPGAKYLGRINCPETLNQSMTDGDPETTSRLFQFWIPLKKKIHFIRDDVTTPSGLPQNGVIVLFASVMKDGVATSVTTVPHVDMHATLYWKDV